MSHKRFQVYSLQPVDPPKAWKKRYGLYGIDWETDTLYLPAELFGNPQALLMCASFDGEPMANYGKTILLRSEWLKKECTKSLSDIEYVESKVREAQTKQAENVQGFDN
jgi:hypothetical protein